MRHIAGWITAWRKQPAQFRGLLLKAGFCLLILAQGLPAQEAVRGSGGADPAARSLARYVPRRGLAFYLEFDGLDAHAADWHASAAYKLLVDTKLGALLEDLGVQALDLLQASLPADRRTKGADLVEAHEEHRQARIRGGLRARGRGRLEGRGRAPRGRSSRGSPVDREPGVRDVAKDGAATSPRASRHRLDRRARPPHPLTKELVWWVEQGDLVLAGKSVADEVMAVIDGKEPSAVDHPLLSRAQEARWRLPACGNRLRRRGRAGTFVSRGRPAWSRWRAASGSAVGVPGSGAAPWCSGCWPQGPAGDCSRCSTSGPSARTRFLPCPPTPPASPSSRSTQPGPMTSLPNWGTPNSARAPPNPRRVPIGVFRHAKSCSSSSARRSPFTPKRPSAQTPRPSPRLIVEQLAGWTLSAPVRDEAAVAGAIDPLIAMVSQRLKRQLRLAQNRGLIAPVWSVDVRPTAEPRGYTLEYVNSQPVVLAKLRPTVAVSRGQLVFAGSPAAAERALAGGPHWQPAGEFVPVVNRLPAEMIYLSLQDPRIFAPIALKAVPILVRQINAEVAVRERQAGQTAAEPPLRLEPDMIPAPDAVNRLLFPSSTALVVDRQGATLIHREAFPSLTSPASAGVIVALCLPAIQSAREAARRSQCVNNLKMIALAMHNYHSTNNAFPRPAITDAKGKPLLSWRVAILPFIDQQALYNRFKLDEPWDSPHNKELLKEMPATYLCPTRGNADPSTTTYRVPTGNGALFEHGSGYRRRQYHRRHVQHDHGRRMRDSSSLDQARRHRLRPGGGTVAPGRRLAAPRRIQRVIRRRRGPVYQQHDRSEDLPCADHPRRRRSDRRWSVLKRHALWSNSLVHRRTAPRTTHFPAASTHPCLDGSSWGCWASWPLDSWRSTC